MQEAQINPFRGHQTMAGMQENYRKTHQPTNEYVVEQNIPLPTKCEGRRQVANTKKRVLLASMDIGDSFAFFTDEEFKRFMYVIGKMRKTLASKKFTVRKVREQRADGWRIWRLA